MYIYIYCVWTYMTEPIGTQSWKTSFGCLEDTLKYLARYFKRPKTASKHFIHFKSLVVF